MSLIGIEKKLKEASEMAAQEKSPVIVVFNTPRGVVISQEKLMSQFDIEYYIKELFDLDVITTIDQNNKLAVIPAKVLLDSVVTVEFLTNKEE